MSGHVAAWRVRPAYRERIWDRLAWGVASCAIGILFAIARTLAPAASGMGTHVQLGLPGCGFLALTHLPCPACGLTTAFAHMARGHVVSAAHAQPVGVALFTCAAMVLPICVLGCLRGWATLATLKELRLARLGAIIAVSALLSWSARLLAICSA